MGDGAGGRGSDISRNVIAALPVAFLLPFVAGLAAVLDGAVSGPRVSTAATFTALVAVFLSGFLALTRRRRPRAALLAACHALAWSPFLAIGAWQAIETGIVQGHMRGCGNGLMAMYAVAVPVGGFALLAGGMASGALLAHRETDRALRAVAVVATGLALVAFAFALPRIARPDPDTYLASLPLEGELRTDSEVQMAGRAFRYHRVLVTDPPLPQPDEGPGDPLPPRSECQLNGLDRVETFYPGAGVCPVLRLRTDPGHDLAVLDAAPYRTSSGVVPIAFHPSTGEELGITAVTVADRIGPPIGWTLGAGIGGLAGVVLSVAAARARRRAASLAGTEAQHAGGGWVVLPSGDRVLVECAAELPVGAVILGEVTEQLPTYRIMGVPRFASARPGTLAVLRSATTDLAASLDGMAIAVAALGATPLIVARIAGVF